ncbi:MAG: hypothetical protein Q4A67_00155 [Aerococcus sp.]|nr:hypothetical protein [Aerococcus sp.]
MRKFGPLYTLLIASIGVLCAVLFFGHQLAQPHSHITIQGNESLLDHHTLEVVTRKEHALDSDITTATDHFTHQKAKAHSQGQKQDVLKAFPLWHRPNLMDQQVVQFADQHYLAIANYYQSASTLKATVIDTQKQTVENVTTPLKATNTKLTPSALFLNRVFKHQGKIYVRYDRNFNAIDESMADQPELPAVLVIFDPKTHTLTQKSLAAPNQSTPLAVTIASDTEELPELAAQLTLTGDKNDQITLTLETPEGEHIQAGNITAFVKDRLLTETFKSDVNTDDFSFSNILRPLAESFVVVKDQLYAFSHDNEGKSTLYRWDQNKQAMQSVLQVDGLISTLTLSDQELCLLTDQQVLVLDKENKKVKTSITVTPNAGEIVQELVLH